MRISTFISLLCCAALSSGAGERSSFYYEGQLPTRVSQRVSVRCYNSSTAENPYAITDTVTLTPDENRNFAVMVPIELPDSGECWIELNNPNLSLPRIRVATSPFAIMAGVAQRIDNVGGPQAERISVGHVLSIPSVLGKEVILSGPTIIHNGFDDTNEIYLEKIVTDSDSHASVLRNHKGGLTTAFYDNITEDASCSVRMNAFTYNADRKLSIQADNDGLALVALRTYQTRDTSSYYIRASIKTDSLQVANDLNPHQTDWKTLVFTFPVKKGEFVNVNLKAHRATILYTTDFDCKLKMYYFGR